MITQSNISELNNPYRVPKMSVCVPIYDMPNGDYFLTRLVNSLIEQTFRDFEVVITKQGKMAENTNAAIKKAKGEIIKILYQDDYLKHDTSLQKIVDNFKGGWLVTGCSHDNGNGHAHDVHRPDFAPEDNENHVGSPSVLAFENKDPLLFNEELTWVLDVDLYKRLYERYGMPTILDEQNVVIGIGDHQMTNILSDEIKRKEHKYIYEKYQYQMRRKL